MISFVDDQYERRRTSWEIIIDMLFASFAHHKLTTYLRLRWREIVRQCPGSLALRGQPHTNHCLLRGLISACCGALSEPEPVTALYLFVSFFRVLTQETRRHEFLRCVCFLIQHGERFFVGFFVSDEINTTAALLFLLSSSSLFSY